MSIQGYILISCVPDKTKQVYNFLQSANVLRVDIVTGPYDLITIIERESTDEILDFVVKDLRYTNGVINTVTCFAITIRR